MDTPSFTMKLDEIQPSQLYISSAKLARVMTSFDPLRPESLAPIPVKALGDRVIMTDGHTRAFAAFSCGLAQVRVFWDEDELDWEAYAICVEWCVEAGIRTIAGLEDRVVDPQAYQVLWLDRCAEMHCELEARRKTTRESMHGPVK
jgi:hypothetical protein